MNIPDVWRNVGKRIGFYTKETMDEIPDAPGIYAWFLPLWIYAEGLAEYVRLINSIFCYDSSNQGRPVANVHANFNWDIIKVRLEKHPMFPHTESLEDLWKKVTQDPKVKAVFAQALMEASILMPPLYVGKTDSLSTRYFQHTRGSDRQDNVFQTRFVQFSKQLSLPLEIDDLLFVAISTDSPTNRVFREYKLNDLLERLVMSFSCPPFGIR